MPRTGRCPRRPGLRLAAAVRPGGARRWPVLPGGTSDIGGDDVGGMPVQTATGTVIPHRGPGISGVEAVPGRLAAQPDPGVQRGGDERVPQRVRPDRLGDPGRRATRRTIRPAPCRSSRRPSAARKTGPSLRSPMARSIARAVRGASGIVTTLPPLRVTTKVRCPRSTPRPSMLAPVASETRSPFRASREISACSAAAPSPAATRIAPSSFRSSPVACDS